VHPDSLAGGAVPDEASPWVSGASFAAPFVWAWTFTGLFLGPWIVVPLTAILANLIMRRPTLDSLGWALPGIVIQWLVVLVGVPLTRGHVSPPLLGLPVVLVSALLFVALLDRVMRKEDPHPRAD
jgi:hypothetical protein